MATAKQRQAIPLVEVAKSVDAPPLQAAPNNRHAEAGALRSHASVGRAGSTPALDTFSHPLTPIDAIAVALQPVTVTLDAADAFIGCKQLRSIVAAFRMPVESRELLLRLATAMERAQ